MSVVKFIKITILLSWIPICLIYYNNFSMAFASRTFLSRSHKDVKIFNVTYYKDEAISIIHCAAPVGVGEGIIDDPVVRILKPPGDSQLGLMSFIYSDNNQDYLLFVSSKARKYPLNLPLTITQGTEKYLINTPGCYIPNYGKTLKFKEAPFSNRSCGVRAVFVKKVDNNIIELQIDKAKINTYSHEKTYYCCVRFAAPQNISGKIYLTKLEYSSCTNFHNGSRLPLEQEIVTVSCYSKSTSIYEDAYIILKKIPTSKPQNLKPNSWNILVLGMDTMSRARLLASMPHTARYLRERNWLDFRAYHKVGYNTFPNVMALMTGKNVSTAYKLCSSGLDKCSKYLLWNKFKEAGYITAYGEEFVTLPDTFSKFDGFQKSPTDHYMRPFFLTGEIVTGNYVCTKKMTSVNHMLNYAHQFSNAYKKQNFYGLFWMNSCSHNLNNNPTLFDDDFLAFFEKMYNDGIMDNTFIIFISDHGIRYGSMRVPVESYYEERLPMCYMWVPKTFRELFPEKYMNLQLNQERLVTPYDLYLTMEGILKVSQESDEVTTSDACPLCESLFKEVSVYRTCTDAGIDEKWCSCHNMIPVDSNKSDIVRSLKVITEQLEKRTTNTKTTNCTECYKFKIKTTLRSHLYEDTVLNKTYYVVAFLVDPGDIGYEAIVQKNFNQFSLVPYMDTITPYNTKGYCVSNANDRGFCVCKTTCKKKLSRKQQKRNKKFIRQNTNVWL